MGGKAGMRPSKLLPAQTRGCWSASTAEAGRRGWVCGREDPDSFRSGRLRSDRSQRGATALVCRERRPSAQGEAGPVRGCRRTMI